MLAAPDGAELPSEHAQPARAMRLDEQRREVLEQLTVLLTTLIEQAHVLGVAALQPDMASVSAAAAALAALASDPVLNLSYVTEIYAGLRTAIANRQPGRRSPGRVPAPPAGILEPSRYGAAYALGHAATSTVPPPPRPVEGPLHTFKQLTWPSPRGPDPAPRCRR